MKKSEIKNLIKEELSKNMEQPERRKPTKNTPFNPKEIPSDKIERVKEMIIKTFGIDQSIRNILGFDEVYKSDVSVKDNKIIISINSRSRK
jgi:hypothetical protein